MLNYYESLQEDTFNYIPVTFHIQEGKKDKEYQKFFHYFGKR